MDYTTLVVEVVAGLFMLLGVVITGRYNAQKQTSDMKTMFQQQNAEQDKQFQKQNLEIKAELSRYEAVNDQKITALTQQVEKHNGVIERVYKLEKEVAVMKAKSGGHPEAV